MNIVINDKNGVTLETKDKMVYENITVSIDPSLLAQNINTGDILQLVYPVGAVYISINNVDPANLFGFGTWEQIQDRFLLAAGTNYLAGSTGGEASVTLTTAQTPNVIGDITMHGGGISTNISNVSGCFSANITNTNKYKNGGTEGTGANSIGIIHFDNGGQNRAHNNMPPYLTVYMWQRTA